MLSSRSINLTLPSKNPKSPQNINSIGSNTLRKVDETSPGSHYNKFFKKLTNSSISRSSIEQLLESRATTGLTNRNINENTTERGIKYVSNDLKLSPHYTKNNERAQHNEAFESLIDKLKKKLKTSIINTSPSEFNSAHSIEKSSVDNEKIYSPLSSRLCMIFC